MNNKGSAITPTFEEILKSYNSNIETVKKNWTYTNRLMSDFTLDGDLNEKLKSLDSSLSIINELREVYLSLHKEYGDFVSSSEFEILDRRMNYITSVIDDIIHQLYEMRGKIEREEE